eukprot:7025397-Alexandrium_andersonii.AAC.1
MPVEDVIAAGQRPISARFAMNLKAAMGTQRMVYQIRPVAPHRRAPVRAVPLLAWREDCRR